MFYCVFILTDLKSEFCDVITYLFFLFLNLQIACVIVPIGQKAHHVLGLKKIITIRPIRSDVRHQAVKSEAELCHPIREYTSRICPSPRNTECPKQFDCFTQIFRTACHKVGLKNHIAEHGKEKYQKTISKPSAPRRRPLILSAGVDFAVTKITGVPSMYSMISKPEYLGALHQG